jgi:mono/diheme cytochrome c family protein
MKFLFLFSLVFAVAGTSCYYDKFENFKPAVQCDTSSVVKYSTNVKAIIDANCNNCHSGTASSGGGIVLDNYTALKNTAVTGKLISSVTWDGKASQMPKGAFDKIDACSISTLKKWISNNYPQ